MTFGFRPLSEAAVGGNFLFIPNLCLLLTSFKQSAINAITLNALSCTRVPLNLEPSQILTKPNFYPWLPLNRKDALR